MAGVTKPGTGGAVVAMAFAWFFFVGVAELTGQDPDSDPHWKLVFDEEFDSLDLSFWKVANDFDHYGEPQVYTSRPENIRVEDGVLVIQIRNERYLCRPPGGNNRNRKWYNYTSGWIEAGQNLDIRFGYLEARIRVPHGKGFWPAFWTFGKGSNRSRSNAAEIDVFEMLGNRPPTVMGTNMHLDYCGCNENQCRCEFLNDQRCPESNPSILCHGLDVKIPDYSAELMTYGLEWTPAKIIWYVNGKVVRNSPNPGIVDPVRVIFNLAIAPWNLPDKSTPFPSRMEIDYFRLYRLAADDRQEWKWNRDKGSGETIASMPTLPDTLRIGGGEGPVTVPVNQPLTLRATTEIEINGEFSVPLGAELYLDANPLITEMNNQK